MNKLKLAFYKLMSEARLGLTDNPPSYDDFVDLTATIVDETFPDLTGIEDDVVQKAYNEAWNEYRDDLLWAKQQNLLWGKQQ